MNKTVYERVGDIEDEIKRILPVLAGLVERTGVLEDAITKAVLEIIELKEKAKELSQPVIKVMYRNRVKPKPKPKKKRVIPSVDEIIEKHRGVKEAHG
jgi:hypothetical protein